MIDQDGISRDIGKIAHEMYEWEELIPEELEMTPADVNSIKTSHPKDLRLQA